MLRGAYERRDTAVLHAGVVTRNFWTEQAPALAEAYARNSGPIRFEVVTRALREHLSSGPQRIVDVGGGYGRQAVMLARLGHSVVVADHDPTMLAMAREAVKDEARPVRARIELVLCVGEAAARVVGADFDLACCHSVLMYVDDPAPMVSSLVQLVRPGGLISVLSVNKDAIAMRSGLQGRWREAAECLLGGSQAGDRYAPSKAYARKDIVQLLGAAGARIKKWYGVGIFTDHLATSCDPDEIVEACALEWLAGGRDPYRQVARCFHLIAQRNRTAGFVEELTS